MKIKDAVALQREIFLNGLGGNKPSLPLNYSRLREAAARKLARPIFDYIDGGAGKENTMEENRKSLDSRKILPRMLRQVHNRDLSVQLFGKNWPHPLFLCPVGLLGMVHPQADLAVARACQKTGTPFMISTQASRSMEEISDKMPDTPRFFQLYWSKSEELVESLVQRAESCGFDAIIVTLDNTLLGWRVRDLEHAHLPFLRGQGLAQYFSDPVFRKLVTTRHLNPGGPKPKFSFRLLYSLWEMADNYPGSAWNNLRSGVAMNAIRTFSEIFINPSLTWEDLLRLRQMTKLPIVLKGIQHPADARKAVDLGMDGIQVSNHGGRQVDGAIGSLDALAQIKKEVQNEIVLFFDSGIRSGSDILKALALGAQAVGIGRPYVYSLALEGESGVTKLIEYLIADLEINMALSGCRAVKEVHPDLLHHCQPV